MPVIDRLFDFTSGTKIESDQVDAELNQIIEVLDGLGGGGLDADNFTAAFKALLEQTRFEVGDYAWSARGTKAGWLICDGTASGNRTTHADLYAVLTFTLVGSLTNADPEVTGISSTANLVAGMPVEGVGIPPGTTVLSVDSGTAITLSAAATATLPAGGMRFFPYGAGNGSTTFNVPDVRGRPLVGKGTNVEHDMLGKSEGLAVGSRQLLHTHTQTHTHTTPNHSHNVAVAGTSAGAATSGTEGGNLYATTANPVATPHHHTFSAAGFTDVTGAGTTSGVSIAATGVTGTPWMTANCFIKI